MMNNRKRRQAGAVDMAQGGTAANGTDALFNIPIASWRTQWGGKDNC